jgi:ER-bound oxygenase mpaB/B'/Rubber oxygenase, catalytic domain
MGMAPLRDSSQIHAARLKYGRRADRVVEHLFQADDLADRVLESFSERRRQGSEYTRTDADMFKKALHEGIGVVQPSSGVPTALRDLFNQVEETPLWLDQNLLELGARTYLRCGAMTGLVLGCCCLPLAYRSAIGNKPLAYTRKLVDRAGRRLGKTGGFFLATCTPAALLPHGPAWRKTVEVRMQHAQMRRLLRQTTWKLEDWGQPINQLHLAGTGLLFSVNLLRHLRQLGFHFSAEESEGVMHLWRYSGYLMGIKPELLCATETEGRNFVEMVLHLTGTPDEDSRKLTQALMESALPEMMETALPWLASPRENPEAPATLGWLGRRLAGAGHGLARLFGLGDRAGRVRFCYGLSHGLLGNHALELNYPKSLWRYTAPALLWSVIAPLETCRRFVPGATRLATFLGHKWSRLMDE